MSNSSNRQSDINTFLTIIEQQNNTIALLTKNGEDMQNTIRDLRQTIANLEETIAELNRRFFGISSEHSKNISLPADKESDIAEDISEDDAKEPPAKTKKSSKPRKPKASREELYASLPICEVKCPLPDDQKFCPDCGTPLEPMGYTFVREELRVIPAKLFRVRYLQQKMRCPGCHEEDETTIVAAPAPASLFPHSPASPSLVAMIMYRKAGLYLPFYRQEMDFGMSGVPIPRETQARWFIKGALEYLEPIYSRLHEELLRRDLIHADEVPCQVLHEDGRKATQKSYMWIYQSGSDGKPPVALYEYQPGRASVYPIEFLKGFHGMIQCDGYAAYGCIEDVILICCLAHARRKFFDAVPKGRQKRIRLLDINSEQALDEPISTEEDENLLPAEKGVAFCNRLFFKERLYKELSPEERKAKRLEEETPIWDEFWSWIDTLDPSGGSKLEKAVKYALNHKESLMNYLLDGRCEISNNSAERKAKVYATGRKNFLFHDYVDGAKATAIVMSLVETAKANNLNAYKYLYTLLLYMPDYKNEPSGIEQLLPWSIFVQDKCSGIIDDSLELPENRGNLPI